MITTNLIIKFFQDYFFMFIEIWKMPEHVLNKLIFTCHLVSLIKADIKQNEEVII